MLTMGLDGVFPDLRNEPFEAPHCDSSVLHSPGECRYCDHFPQRQADRVAQRINFTGHDNPGMAPCPSTAFRVADTVHRWPGNRPSKVLDHDFMPPLEHRHGVAHHMTAQHLDHLQLAGPEHTEPGHVHDVMPVPAVYDHACGQQFPPDTSFCNRPAWMHHDWTGMYGGVSQAQLEELAQSVATKTSPKPTLTADKRGPGQFHTHAPLEGQVPRAKHVHAHVENDYPGHTHDGLQAQAAIYDPVVGDTTSVISSALSFEIPVTSSAWFSVPAGLLEDIAEVDPGSQDPGTAAAAFQELRMEFRHLWDELVCVAEAAAKVVRRWWRS